MILFTDQFSLLVVSFNLGLVLFIHINLDPYFSFVIADKQAHFIFPAIDFKLAVKLVI